MPTAWTPGHRRTPASRTPARRPRRGAAGVPLQRHRHVPAGHRRDRDLPGDHRIGRLPPGLRLRRLPGRHRLRRLPSRPDSGSTELRDSGTAPSGRSIRDHATPSGADQRVPPQSVRSLPAGHAGPALVPLPNSERSTMSQSRTTPEGRAQAGRLRGRPGRLRLAHRLRLPAGQSTRSARRRPAAAPATTATTAPVVVPVGNTAAPTARHRRRRPPRADPDQRPTTVPAGARPARRPTRRRRRAADRSERPAPSRPIRPRPTSDDRSGRTTTRRPTTSAAGHPGRGRAAGRRRPGKDGPNNGLDVLGRDCTESNLPAAHRLPGVHAASACSTSMGEVAAEDKLPSLLITAAPTTVGVGEASSCR